MNRQQAKEILSLFRPGTADEKDQAFDEAISWCGTDAELKRWFDAHCAAYNAMRARFKAIPVPEGLKEQIIAERKVHTQSLNWKKALVATAAVATIVVSISYLGMNLREIRNRTALPAFREWTVSNSLRVYQMNLETNDLREIRSYLARNKFDSEFTVPGPLEANARPTGCTLLQWNGKPVTMVCFHSGKQLAPGVTSDLFLFIADASAVRNPVQSISVTTLDPTTTATWTANGKLYLLVAEGDEKFLRKYL